MVYALVFGLVGRHPLAILAVQVALVATAAVLLHDLLQRFVRRELAVATAVLWLVIPNHTSLLLWATATPITLSLVLLLLGGVALADDRCAPAALCFAAAVLTYEATAPAALALLVAIPRLQRRPWRRPLAIGLAGLVPASGWALLHVPSVKAEGLSRWADLRLLLPAHLGWGVLPDGPIATVGGLAALVGLTSLAVWARSGRNTGVSAPKREVVGLVAAGLATIVIGTLPFVRYFYEPLGAGDRVNVVAGVGTAMVWAGLLALLAEVVPWRPMAVAVAGAVVLAMAAANIERSSAWAAAADDADRILAALPPPHAQETFTIEHPPVRQNVTAFADRSNIESAVQLEQGTRAVIVRLRPAR